jgi:hypothetical protein
MTDRLLRAVAGFLGEQERIVAARRVAPAGELGGRLGEAAGGAVGGILGAGAVHGLRRAPTGELTKVGVVAVTNQRLLLIAVNRLGKPSQVLASVELPEVRALRAERARVAFGKLYIDMTDDSLAFDLRSDRDIDCFITAVMEVLPPAT